MKGQEELARLEIKLKEAEQQVQRAHKENDALTQKTQKLQQVPGQRERAASLHAAGWWF